MANTNKAKAEVKAMLNAAKTGEKTPATVGRNWLLTLNSIVMDCPNSANNLGDLYDAFSLFWYSEQMTEARVWQRCNQGGKR